MEKRKQREENECPSKKLKELLSSLSQQQKEREKDKSLKIKSISLTSCSEDLAYVEFPKEKEEDRDGKKDKEFLGLFRYESMQKGSKEEGKACVFNKCVVLRDFEKYKRGEELDSIWFTLSLYVEKEKDFEEVHLCFE